jgi:hypothetical protein
MIPGARLGLEGREWLGATVLWDLTKLAALCELSSQNRLYSSHTHAHMHTHN